MRKERLEAKSFETPREGFKDIIGVGRMLRVIWAFTVVHLSYITPVFMKNFLLGLTGMEIGRGTLIAPTMSLDFTYPEEVSIGENCVLGSGCTILAHEITPNELRHGKTEIGDNVLIGANATVLPGVKINDGAVVAAGAVVTRDIEEGQRVGGVPARPLQGKAGDRGT